MNTNDSKPSPDNRQAVEGLLGQFQPAPAKASMAETFYRAGYAAAEAERVSRKGTRLWRLSPFVNGLASGVAACVLLGAGWNWLSSNRLSQPVIASHDASPPEAHSVKPSSDTPVSSGSPLDRPSDGSHVVQAGSASSVGRDAAIFNAKRPSSLRHAHLQDRNSFDAALSYVQSQQWDRTQSVVQAYSTRTVSAPNHSQSSSSSRFSDRADRRSLWQSLQEGDLGL